MTRVLTPLRLLLLATAALAACESGTDPLRPAAFRVLTPDGITATVGSAVTAAPAVRVTTTDGRAVAGVAVVFSAGVGGGTVSGAQQVTGADGTARAGSWVLGGQAGENVLTVTSPAMPGVQADIRATGLADVPAILALLVQPATATASGTPLPIQPIVRLLDRFGNASPTSGITVSAAAAGEVTVENGTAITDATGTAAFSGLTLRGRGGPYVLRFGAPGLAEAVASYTTELSGGTAHHLEVVVQPPASGFPGLRLNPAPVIRVSDEYGNSVSSTAVTISATLEGAGGSLAGTTTVPAPNGTAAFADLVLADTGTYRLRFAADPLGAVMSDTFRIVSRVPLDCAAAGRVGTRLAFQLGQTVRHRADAGAPTCLEFDAATAAGQQYLVLFENMPLQGEFARAVFPSPVPSPSTFQFSIQSQPAEGVAAGYALSRAFPNALAAAEREAPHQWDFGDGPIYEGRVPPRPAGLPAAKALRDGQSIALSLALAHPQVGDIVPVYLLGIERLGILAGTQSAVVRHVSDHLIIAEDVRLAQLTRPEGGTNRSLTAAELDSIAAQYALHANVQGNLLFDGRFNAAVEGWGQPPRVLAVHTLMYADNIWGYTWPNNYYFAFDYWVGQTGGTTKGLAQNAQRLADNLFMHEIAHIRHYGLLERAGRTGARGNQWLVEGFARFSERLPIAMRLLGSVQPSRTDNVVLPRNPAFGNAYYYDDVPTYLQTGAAMVGGYGASSYVFDYFADQVALAGGDPIRALREFATFGGDEASLDQVIARWLPQPIGFTELFTRARIALYADDYGAGLPPATQYLQYQLRASRPPGSNSALDPRNAWLSLSPGIAELVAPVSLEPGTARGVVLDGAVAGAGSARVLIDATAAPNGVISITRIR